MITNELQLKVTQRKLQSLREALQQLTNRPSQDEFSNVHKGGLHSLIADMEAEVEEYHKLWGSASEQPLTLETPLEQLGQALIRLRLARGISQRELAERLGVTSQQVQQDEEREYASLTVGRLMKILEALQVKADLHMAA